jgi:hypothetical protein
MNIYSFHVHLIGPNTNNKRKYNDRTKDRKFEIIRELEKVGMIRKLAKREIRLKLSLHNPTLNTVYIPEKLSEL